MCDDSNTFSHIPNEVFLDLEFLPNTSVLHSIPPCFLQLELCILTSVVLRVCSVVSSGLDVSESGEHRCYICFKFGLQVSISPYNVSENIRSYQCVRYLTGSLNSLVDSLPIVKATDVQEFVCKTWMWRTHKRINGQCTNYEVRSRGILFSVSEWNI